jgi:hypothetical protein
MIVNEISEKNDKKDLIVIPGILNHSETLSETHDENLKHLLTDPDTGGSLYCIDKVLQNSNPFNQCLINVLHIKNKHIFSVPLFQPPYYYPGSDPHDTQSLSINFGGIGTFIAFQIMSVRKTEILDHGHEISKIKLLLEKNQIHVSEFDQKDTIFVQLVQDVVSMIRGLNLSLSALIHALEQNGETLQSDRLESCKELFFESYACAHINNTRTYMVNGKQIKLTGRFWVNIINDLNIFTS